jgi:hypothetical protein
VSGLASWAAALNLDDSGDIQWAEEPVPLTAFVQDRGYLGQPPLSEIQYQAVRHAERIFYARTYASLATSADPEIAAYWAEPCRDVNFLELEWGKGGGKDHTCRVTSLRIAYLLICLPSPQAYYEMPEQDTIHMLNVASNSRQASRAFFKPMRQMVSREGGWFYRQGVQAIEASTRDRRRNALQGGEAERMVLQDTIRFPKNVEAISGHSDADAQEGLNLILGLADEIDAFPRAEELAKYHAATARGDSSRSAEAIVAMLRSSARTRFPLIFKNIHISWPRYVGSMIQVLVADAERDIQAKGPVSRFYTSGPHASWEVNPRVQVACPEHQRYTPGCAGCWDACKALFEDDYIKDPARARAMYEGKPSRAVNPYFSNELTVRQAFREAAQAPLGISYITEISGRSWRPVYEFAPGLLPVVGAQYAMHCDLAISGDKAGIALAHVIRWEDRVVTGRDAEDGVVEVTEQRPVVKVDFLAAYAADKRAEPPLEIQIRWARLLCLELIRRGFNIRLFSADGFESADSRQIMESHGIETAVVSTDRASQVKQDGLSQGEALWRNIRDLCAEARLEVAGPLTPPEAPKDTLLTFYDTTVHELLALSRMPNGKIDHPPGGSKDIADALAGAVAGAIYLGGREDEDGAQAYPASGLEQWSGPPRNLPEGFVSPSAVRFRTPIDHVRVSLDSMGRPEFGGMPDFGEEPARHQG